MTIWDSQVVSQPSASFNSLSMMNRESFVQEQLDELFGTVAAENAVFPSTYGGASEDLDVKYDLSYYEAVSSPAPSTLPTSNFSDYNFSQPSSSYSTPAPNSPHPYPIEQQQYFNPNLGNAFSFRPRLLPKQGQTNTPYLHPPHPPPQYLRRRSLSQSDAGIPVSTSPTFFKMLSSPDSPCCSAGSTGARTAIAPISMIFLLLAR